MNDRKIVTLDDIERRHLLSHRDGLVSWHRQLVTLASGGLTLLVSLQSSYVPQGAQGLALLQTCWLALAVCICSGLLVLFGEAQTPLDAANHLRRLRHHHGDVVAGQYVSGASGAAFRERRIFSLARHLLVGSFLVAMVCLAWFAVLNVGKPL